ncbi:ATP-binding cassette domain-containing protein [Collinsella sp. AF16-8]|nr:ATP-binding cassette domain-containing protein [Collinsella sp. AF16-8]
MCVPGSVACDLRNGNIKRKNEHWRVHNGELVLLDGVRILQILFELFQIISGREGLVRPIGGSVGRRRGPRHHLGWARGEHIVVQHRVPICGKALLVPRSLRGGREGETYAITGPNGCGKSTFLKVLLGLYSAGGHRTLGSVPYEELDMETIRHDLFAVCPQKLFIPNETVEHYLERASIRGTGEHLCELVPSFCRTVESLKGKNCRDLSGGEYRKLRIISALCRQPEVLVFDEPTNDLDEESRREFTEYVSRNPFNQLILVVSHDQDLILACDKKLDLNFDSKDGQC